MGVTYSECFDAFVQNGGAKAQERFTEWSTKPDRVAAGVIDFVTGFTHNYICTSTRTEFNDTAAQTHHPLGNISPQNPVHLEGIRMVEDLDTPWSFMQLFHMYAETNQVIPTWQDWSGWLKGEAEPYLWGPYKQLLNYEALSERGQKLARIGVAWRLGNAYYSALRELDIMTALRDRGINLKYHLLADALFAVDFWLDNRIASVYIPNERYKSDEDDGRKRRPQVLLANRSFKFARIEIIKQKVFAAYWPVSTDTIDKVAAYFGAT